MRNWKSRGAARGNTNPVKPWDSAKTDNAESLALILLGDSSAVAVSEKKRTWEENQTIV
jgi:hypothetical protein